MATRPSHFVCRCGQPERGIMKLTLIAALIVAIAGVVFAMQNNVPVTVNFLFWRFDSSLVSVLLVTVAMSAIVVILMTAPATLRRQWLLTRQNRRIEELEKTAATIQARISELEKDVTASS
jgi:uncharacterized integral membrane protein